MRFTVSALRAHIHRTPSPARWLFAVAVFLVVTGCSGDNQQSDAHQPSNDANQSTSSAKGSSSPAPERTRPSRATLANGTAQGQQVEVNRVLSDSTGFTIVYWTLTNEGDGSLYLRDFFDERHYGTLAYFQDQYPWYLGPDMKGVEVVLQEQGQRYLPITDSDSNCLCSSSVRGNYDLAPGESVYGYSAYYIPSGVEEIAVSFPGADELIREIPVEAFGVSD